MKKIARTILIKYLPAVFIYVFCFFLNVTAQNIAITDEEGYTPEASAMLDVYSINKGMLVPRVALVSTSDPVSGTKPEGLLVWNTSTSGSYPDPGFYYWSGTDWVKVGSSALDFENGLIHSGNTVKLGGTLTETTTLTLGSTPLNINLTESGDFNVQDDGTSVLFVRDDGNVGVGTTAPSHKLEVNGNIKLDDNIMIEGSSAYKVYRNLVSYSATSTQGAFVINTNQPQASNCMFRLKVEGYLYKSSGPLEITVGAYTTSSGLKFYNKGYINIGSEKLAVRLAKNASTGNLAIILGDTTTTYSYPKLTVTEFCQGYSGLTESYADGWIITQETSLSGYDNKTDVPDVTNLDNRYYTEAEVDGLISNSTFWNRTSGKLFPKTLTDNVGIGTSDPFSRLEVQGNQSGNEEDPLFEVKRNDGQTVFAVYPEGVRIYVDEDVTKGIKGGFAVGGFSASKGITNEYLRITPDTVRIYVDDTGTGKGIKGGFAVGGFGTSKGLTNEYLRVTPDSVRVYVDNDPESKGMKGGFAVGGFSAGKGYEDAINFMDLTPENYLIGHESGQQITNGQYNTFFGFEAGYKTEGGIEVSPGQWQGCNNIFIGYQAGYDNVTGYKNVFIGYKSGANNTSGEKNIFIGNESGEVNTTGSYNSFIGYNAGILNSSGIGNTFLGSNCGFYNSTGWYNTCLGSHTGEYLDACGANTFIGTYSGHGGGTPGSYPSAKITGNYNTFLGYRSGYDNLSGSNNTYIGCQSGHENESGTGNVFIGYKAGYNESGSNRLYIDNTDTSTPLIYGDFSTNDVQINGDICWTGTSGSCSDIKYKKNVMAIQGALEKIQKINGVYYFWRSEEFPEMEFSEGRQIGIIAQEIEKFFPELVGNDANGYRSVDYSKITAVLIEALKEQQNMIEELKRENSDLKYRLESIDDLQNQIDQLKDLFISAFNEDHK
jgi:hypothetical protein